MAEPFTDRTTFRAHLAGLNPTALLPDFGPERFIVHTTRGTVVAAWAALFLLDCVDARSLTNADAIAILDAIPEAH